jgi:large subunit ribosomal protein L21
MFAHTEDWSMYAVVRSGGRQHRVSPGDVLRVERLDAQVGETVTLDEVLLVDDGERTHIDAAKLGNARVTARVTAHGKGPKILVFKYKRRKRYRRKYGHRQHYTELAIENVEI